MKFCTAGKMYTIATMEVTAQTMCNRKREPVCLAACAWASVASSSRAWSSWLRTPVGGAIQGVGMKMFLRQVGHVTGARTGAGAGAGATTGAGGITGGMVELISSWIS